jgi:hypothetical protein
VVLRCDEQEVFNHGLDKKVRENPQDPSGNQDVRADNGRRKTPATITNQSTKSTTVSNKEHHTHQYSPWVPPFLCDEVTQAIVDSNGRRIVDMQGWGFLTLDGPTNLNIHEDEALIIQNSIGSRIAALMNADFETALLPVIPRILPDDEEEAQPEPKAEDEQQG